MQTNESKNLAIGVLSTTAVILLTALLLVQSRPESAYADGMSIIQGDYSISVGGITQDSEDLVYVIDSPQKKLNVYRFELQRKEIRLIQTLPLDEMRQSGAQPPAGGNPPKPTPPKPKKP